MSKDKERFDKVWALAVNPGAIEGEALAAFQKMRELVRANPSLAHPPAPQLPPAGPAALPQGTYKARITQVHADWILILVGLLSSRAYELGLKSNISFDFSEPQTAIEVICDGSAPACEQFESHVDWCINYINSELKEK